MEWKTPNLNWCVTNASLKPQVVCYWNKWLTKPETHTLVAACGHTCTLEGGLPRRAWVTPWDPPWAPLTDHPSEPCCFLQCPSLCQTQATYLFFLTKFLFHSSLTLSSSHPKEVSIPPSMRPSHLKMASWEINYIPRSENSSLTGWRGDTWVFDLDLQWIPLVILSRSPGFFLKISKINVLRESPEPKLHVGKQRAGQVCLLKSILFIGSPHVASKVLRVLSLSFVHPTFELHLSIARF